MPDIDKTNLFFALFSKEFLTSSFTEYDQVLKFFLAISEIGQRCSLSLNSIISEVLLKVRTAVMHVYPRFYSSTIHNSGNHLYSNQCRNGFKNVDTYATVFYSAINMGEFKSCVGKWVNVETKMLCEII